LAHKGRFGHEDQRAISSHTLKAYKEKAALLIKLSPNRDRIMQAVELLHKRMSTDAHEYLDWCATRASNKYKRAAMREYLAVTEAVPIDKWALCAPAFMMMEHETPGRIVCRESYYVMLARAFRRLSPDTWMHYGKKSNSKTLRELSGSSGEVLGEFLAFGLAPFSAAVQRLYLEDKKAVERARELLTVAA
jgi:hypothetical protein